MAWQTLSQTISPRVQTLVDAKGDTLIQMSLVDAKTILEEVLEKSYSDSLISLYGVRDSVQKNSITLQKAELKLLTTKFNNQLSITDNLNQVLVNKDTEIGLLNDTIKQQKKEIRKQKILKVIGFIAAVALPITTIILMSH